MITSTGLYPHASQTGFSKDNPKEPTKREPWHERYYHNRGDWRNGRYAISPIKRKRGGV